MMNILILGNGSREQVIKEHLEQYNNHVEIMHDLDFNNIKEKCLRDKINLVIPATEVYLCNGIVDFLRNENINVFGPDKYQAKLEGSKYFSKCLMEELKIPTSNFCFINKINNIYCQIQNKVIKYSGLASGKGVYISNNYRESLDAIEKLYQENKNNWEGIILEDRLYGPEVSLMAFCNGKEAYLMPQTQDYKRIYDNDEGPNTGGMGAIGPVYILTNEELQTAKQYMDKVVKYLNYKGVLYAGLMKTKEGIYFLEFNCRFGDPEAQVLLNLLNTPLTEIIKDCNAGNDLNIQWKENTYVGAVVLAHEDYPTQKSKQELQLEYNPQDLDNNVKIYLSNIKNEDTTFGGRVLTMVSMSNNLKHALENIYNNIYKIKFPGAFYRRDIGSNNISTNTANNKRVAVLASGNATSIEKLLKETDMIKIFITNTKSDTIFKKSNDFNIPCIYLSRKMCTSKTDYYTKICNILRVFNIDLVILSGFMMIVPDLLYDEFETINIHPSLLPNYKGLKDMDLHGKILENKEKFTGCTLHRVVKDVDGGRILLQKQMKIENISSALELKQKVQVLEKECIYDYVVSCNNKIKYDIDIDQANNFVDSLKAKGITDNSFSALFPYKNLVLGASTDGCGTKLDLANEHGFLNTIGIDLVAMNVNDLLAGGIKPLFFMDYIAIDKMNKQKCELIIQGILKGCEISQCKLIGGETAEMKGIYLKNKLDLAGFAIGEQVFQFQTNNINSECYLYGLESSGIHSNGYTLVKKLLENSYYDMNEILKPTKIYMELLDLYKEYSNEILGVAHITGGGLYDNIERLISLNENLEIELYDFEFPKIFKWIQENSGLLRKEMLSTFNCGYGMVLITNKELNIGNKIGKIKYKNSMLL